ncbi:MAG: cyclic di-GMP phosphodiesterase [Agitococcus sp.]|nr:cyclic di-GMP phosphodiesterase [Agitococcus sp.]MDO9177078.1 cyclic di-GMP phosphodiesterase [Agitococcus sp.]
MTTRATPSFELIDHFGTAGPGWSLTSDSDTLQLTGVEAKTLTTVRLSTLQASTLRTLAGETAYISMEVTLFGEQTHLHLVGKKVGPELWEGTAAENTDTATVVSDLSASLAFAEQVVSESNTLIIILDKNCHIQRFNRLCEEVTGVQESDVIGRNALDLFITNDARDASKANIKSFFEKGLASGVERPINTKTGQRLILWRNKLVTNRRNPDSQYVICSGTDITEERLAKDRLVELANTDTLTGLPNRHAVYEQLDILITAPNVVFGVLFLDLDNFKTVNDHYGHVIGDSLIQLVARTIQTCLSTNDRLARLGGDEFLILAKNQTKDEISALALLITTRLRDMLQLNNIEVYSSASMGIAMFPEHGNTRDILIRHADTAMYAAKAQDPGTYRFFDVAMNNKVSEYVWLDRNLRKALVSNELELYYQPKVNLATGETTCVEALIRWNSPERGLISPLNFIPYAEESGLIVPLGAWVLRTAAKQAAEWHAKGLFLRIAVNVSARQLRTDEVIAELEAALLLAKLDYCPIDIELTESCLAQDEAFAYSLIERFRALGAGVHLDDFGTGYSSLSQLGRLPLDVIKLDRSFIATIHESDRAQALVRAMVAVAQELGLAIVAEGVETAVQEQFLARIGVTYSQGYLHSRPLRAADLELWQGVEYRVPVTLAA